MVGRPVQYRRTKGLKLRHHAHACQVVVSGQLVPQRRDTALTLTTPIALLYVPLCATGKSVVACKPTQTRARTGSRGAATVKHLPCWQQVRAIRKGLKRHTQDHIRSKSQTTNVDGQQTLMAPRITSLAYCVYKLYNQTAMTQNDPQTPSQPDTQRDRYMQPQTDKTGPAYRQTDRQTDDRHAGRQLD